MTGTLEGLTTLQFSPDGKYAYAYSGIKASSGTPFNLLDFSTNSEYLIANFTFYFAEQGSGSDMQYKIIMNEQVVGQINIPDTNYNWANNFNFLIPPFTHLEIEQDNLSGSTDRVGASMIAEVKGAIEQQNLESITDNNKWASK